MLIENSNLEGMTSDLGHLDKESEKIGFVRWQWEYTRATYDLKFTNGTDEYFLRFNTRAIEGKLENPDAVLKIEHIYIGRATFPHGLDYESPVPENILKAAKGKLEELKQALA
ncbi:hypothetical protein SY83_15530 [Paenibacillus swuensis]|uniref:YugN-like family protein n=1 Tax=Paenibacillus swuensis TaxID=1178515 RepID=A0A172TKK5_9BACL|nr:YugN family protein [Paenibacillus swuensis]ANE47454.1 hypothetical protein SY83_15530 [Paenibacillus swuensis]